MSVTKFRQNTDAWRSIALILPLLAVAGTYISLNFVDAFNYFWLMPLAAIINIVALVYSRTLNANGFLLIKNCKAKVRALGPGYYILTLMSACAIVVFTIAGDGALKGIVGEGYGNYIVGYILCVVIAIVLLEKMFLKRLNSAFLPAYHEEVIARTELELRETISQWKELQMGLTPIEIENFQKIIEKQNAQEMADLNLEVVKKMAAHQLYYKTFPDKKKTL
ncbi:MAG: hypothetical protein ACI9TY_001467 [Alphaproteobacteria bacterium]|jgi:hypothetical protein